MPQTQTPKYFNPSRICFCCAGDSLALPLNKVPYEARMRYTFVPRSTNSNQYGPVQYCPKCEAQRCENMPGRNHYHLYRYISIPSSRRSPNIHFLQIGRVINTVGQHRESFRKPQPSLPTLPPLPKP